jgi:hypothetical protein
MRCQDVRRTLTHFVDGQLALTEWAIIQGHLVECGECRKELDRLRALASVRARARGRRTSALTAVAMVVVLAVAVVGGGLIYQESFPDPPPRTAAPTVSGADLAAPMMVPAPFVRSAPPASRARGTAEVTPRGAAPPASDPAARATRPVATVDASAEDRMPTTQARPPAVVTAPPDAEEMPTQGPSRSRR